jgi:hypothetical protein
MSVLTFVSFPNIFSVDLLADSQKQGDCIEKKQDCLTWKKKESNLLGLFTSRGCLRLRCEERSECGNLMQVAKNDEIATLRSR